MYLRNGQSCANFDGVNRPLGRNLTKRAQTRNKDEENRVHRKTWRHLWLYIENNLDDVLTKTRDAGKPSFTISSRLTISYGPPSVVLDGANLQLYPLNKNKCSHVDPVRDISFQLYTRHNPLSPAPLRIDDDAALANSHFNFSEPTIFFFHAFFESYQLVPATYIRTAYTQRGDHNIILLNAPRLEAGPWYLTAAQNTRVVGEYAAQFVDYMVSRGLYLPSLHLAGLSLGAHMAGVCGSNVKSGRIRRITGMDPAGPLFTKWPKSLKLDASDAEFVDVIHTDAGIFGYPNQIGHVDFWPNKGIAPQPGCNLNEVKKRNPDALMEYAFCSHWRSYQFFAESVVNPRAFLGAVNCNNWGDYANGVCSEENSFTSPMGLYVDPRAKGNFYIRTNAASPYSKT